MEMDSQEAMQAGKTFEFTQNQTIKILFPED